jgi:hypothetical protein
MEEICHYCNDDNTCRVFWKTADPKDGGCNCNGHDKNCFLLKNLIAKKEHSNGN